MNIEEERRKFEAWFKWFDALGSLERLPYGDGYKYTETHTAWNVWQARAELDKREPLTADQVIDGLAQTGILISQSNVLAFEAGVRFAERAHGIGVEK